jgi:hypothetical protein
MVTAATTATNVMIEAPPARCRHVVVAHLLVGDDVVGLDEQHVRVLADAGDRGAEVAARHFRPARAARPGGPARRPGARRRSGRARPRSRASSNASGRHWISTSSGRCSAERSGSGAAPEADGAARHSSTAASSRGGSRDLMAAVAGMQKCQGAGADVTASRAAGREGVWARGEQRSMLSVMSLRGGAYL